MFICGYGYVLVALKDQNSVLDLLESDSHVQLDVYAGN